MLVAGDGMNVARDSRNGSRRDAAFRNLVAIIGAACSIGLSDEFTTIDYRIEIQFLRIDAQTSFGEQEVAENDARALQTVGDVEHLRNELEAIGDIEWRSNDARIISKGRAQHLPQVPLLCFGWNSCRRTCALAVDDDDGNLHHRGKTKPLAHQGKPAAG